ncbi:MAG TPA: O-antigen ligase family protein [Symbiobacteriaceae bacterium]|nr:O-antigen ligase family protein [Symbiobacteriaceae bacterium]
MARFDVQAAWHTSWFLGFLLRVWEGSIFHRVMVAVLRWVSHLARYSWTRRVLLSVWPAGESFRDSRTGRVLLGLNRWLTGVTQSLSRLLKGAWESSLLVRLARALTPVSDTSWVIQSPLGYPLDTELAPAETGRARYSMLLPMLGAVLGVLALIPSPGPGEGGLNPTILMVLGIWGIGGLWLVEKLMTRDFTWRASSVFLPLVIFLILAGAAALTSPVPSDSMLNYVLWLTAALLFLLTVNLARNTRDVAAFMGPIMVAGVLMALWSVYQFINPPEIAEAWLDPTEVEKGIVRTFAGMNNPNYLALYMELFIPVTVALWVQQPKRRLELTGILGALVLALLLTQSRAGWFGLAVAAVAFILMRTGRWWFLLVFGAVLAWNLAPASIVERVMTAFDPRHTSNVYRENIRIGVIRTIRDNWLLGTGLGAPAFALRYQEHMLAAAGAAHAHNTYLEMLAETGIFGFGVIMWTLFTLLRRTVAAGFDMLRSPVPAAVAAAIIGVLVHGTAEHIWYNPKILFSFWAVAGLGMGLVLGDKEGAQA